MSRTKATTIRVRVPTPQELLMQEIMRNCPGLDALPTHAELAVLARNGATDSLRGRVGAGALDRLEQRRAAVLNDAAVGVAVRTVAPAAWSAAEHLFEQSREAIATSSTRAEALAAEGDRALCTALERGAHVLAAEERTSVTAIMQDALQSIGCRVTTALEPAVTGIWAERGHELVAVLIEDGGRARIDVAGFGGSDCAPFHEEIERAVAMRGGAFEHVEVAEHGDPDGGVLIRNAARAAGPRGDMARAIAQQAAAAPRFSRQEGEAHRAVTPRVPNRGER